MRALARAVERVKVMSRPATVDLGREERGSWERWVRARAAAIKRLGCVDKGKKDATLTISATFVLHFFSRLLLSDFLLSFDILLAIPLFFLLCARTILSFPAA